MWFDNVDPAVLKASQLAGLGKSAAAAQAAAAASEKPMGKLELPRGSAVYASSLMIMAPVC